MNVAVYPNVIHILQPALSIGVNCWHCLIIDIPRNDQKYYMLRLDEAGRINWATNVKNMLFMYGIDFVWIVQEVKEILRCFFVSSAKDWNMI